MIQVPCDLCGGDDHALVLVKEGFRHVRCRACGLVFVNPRQAGHLETQRESGTGTMGDEVLSSSQKRRLHRELELYRPYRKLNRIIEIGAGRGWLLGEASAAGWETWAVEVNSQALAHLGTRGIFRVIPESADSVQAPEAHFDVVRMWDVIEHLESPRKVMERMFRLLRPGGLLRISTTNFRSLSRWVNGPDWVYLNGADHIVLFEPRTVRQLLEICGFISVRIRTRSFNLRKKRYHPEQDLSSVSPLVTPLRKLIDELIRFTPFGHQMVVSAKRPG
ncbi:MAG: class I SAM-dependent methyltransferase [Thermodesulfobacteriota bacterium]